ncbi:MAG: hypothetical protein JWQ40_4786 [Segetibacter sp.]|nr:hypothetical protein [Segetibacter sp.]
MWYLFLFNSPVFEFRFSLQKEWMFSYTGMNVCQMQLGRKTKPVSIVFALCGIASWICLNYPNRIMEQSKSLRGIISN